MKTVSFATFSQAKAYMKSLPKKLMAGVYVMPAGVNGFVVKPRADFVSQVNRNRDPSDRGSHRQTSTPPDRALPFIPQLAILNRGGERKLPKPGRGRNASSDALDHRAGGSYGSGKRK